MDTPFAGAEALDARTKRAYRLCGIEHVLAFEQAADARLTDRKRAKDQRTMRDRFVTGYADAAFERAAATGVSGAGSVRMMQSSGVL